MSKAFTFTAQEATDLLAQEAARRLGVTGTYRAQTRIAIQTPWVPGVPRETMEVNTKVLEFIVEFPDG